MPDLVWATIVVVCLAALGGAVAAATTARHRLRVAERRLAETTAVRDALMARERELAVHASHRLRTPITALRLSLEDLAQWRQTAPEVRAELDRAVGEIDRWGAAVEEVVGGARSRRAAAAVPVDLSDLTLALVEHRDLGARGPVHRTRGPVPTVVDPSAVEEIVGLLIDHLAEHGSGPVRVDVSARATHLQIGVGDDSPPALAPGVVHDGSGPAALAAAGAVAESLGGYLAVADRPRTRFLLMLPPR